MLELETFKTVIKSTPLVAVDFIIKDEFGNVLFGKRTNSPAKGMLCVPGGRVYKDETLQNAVKRKLFEEVGLSDVQPMVCLGVYEHFYSDSILGKEDSTHYITVAFEFTIEDKSLIRTCNQHEEFKFISPSEVLSFDNVPEPIKNYLRGEFKDHLKLNLV